MKLDYLEVIKIKEKMMSDLTNEEVAALSAVATSIRGLSIDAIQKAKSGHPGICLGAAEVVSLLYGKVMKHNSANSAWAARDRFVLSAGHGSMLLYSILHMAGYKVTLSDIKNFRQVGSVCPGHPEYSVTDGVECTTGPLGQGVSIAVGLAVAEEMAAAKFNTSAHKVIDNYTYALVGEGCLEEGVSSESASFAGAMKLGRLIVIYDQNKISIDGSTDMTFSEDVGARYSAYGWQVLNGDMYDLNGTYKLLEEAKNCADKPTLIILKSAIGKYSPLENSADSHGAPLGEENIKATKRALGLDENKTFEVLDAAKKYFDSRRPVMQKAEDDWKKTFAEWSNANPALRALYDTFVDKNAKNATISLGALTMDYEKTQATRAAGGTVLNTVAKQVQNLVGGSADLTGPNKTKLSDAGIFSPTNRAGRYLEFGIREFAMSAICAGITLYGFHRAFCATFLVFADYLRAQLRLTSLMGLPVIYIFTHDSIYVGEDGPTHQSVETLSSLRAIPGVKVLRPANALETALAWEVAINNKSGPTCIVLTRQDLTPFKIDDEKWREAALAYGAYIAKNGSNLPDITILATGSEVSMAAEAIKLYERAGGKKSIRLVSVFDYKTFDEDEAAQKALIGGAKRVITCEAGISCDWKHFATSRSDLFSIDRFGMSGPAKEVAKALHFTSEDLAKKLGE